MAVIAAYVLNASTPPPTSNASVIDERVLVSPIVLTQTVLGSNVSFVAETDAVGYAT